VKIFGYELRLLWRDRAAWILTALFAAVSIYGLTNGAGLAESLSNATVQIEDSGRKFDAQVRELLARQNLDPRQVARQPLPAVLPRAPLPALAAGQADLAPNFEMISLFRLEQQTDARSELENPSRLLSGRFDLAFVLIWLFPLFLLALAYDLLAGDRESGTLRMVLARGVAPWRWLLVRTLARGMPVLAIALAATAATAFVGDPSGALGRMGLACGVVAAYGIFWLALAALVNGFAKSAASAATAVGAAWVVIVLVIPTWLNLLVEGLHPIPSRAELVASAREASGAAERRGGEVVDSFYKDHPEWAPATKQVDFMARALAVQEEVGRALDPVRERFDTELSNQQRIVERWKYVSPAIAAFEALTDIAGTGYWRQRAFKDQVATFKDTVHAFYSPRIHQKRVLSKADISTLPRFEFAEENAAGWRMRTVWAVLGILGLAAIAITLAARRLSARALATLTS